MRQTGADNGAGAIATVAADLHRLINVRAPLVARQTRGDGNRSKRCPFCKAVKTSKALEGHLKAKHGPELLAMPPERFIKIA